MLDRWSTTQVERLGDASSVSAARELAHAARWVDPGHTNGAPSAVWGLCRGSWSAPYQTCIDLAGPDYRCSCPSQKVPCKHALGLLLLWSFGSVPDREPPDWVRDWHAGRTTRAERAVGRKGGAPPTPAQERAARRRADRVLAGVTELDEWLTDQVRNGIVGLDRAGYGQFDQMAARLVDAQAGALAANVRRLAGVAVSGDGWPGRMLAELSMLRLLAGAYRRLDTLPEPLAATVRSRVGFTVPRDQVLASQPVRDVWQVIGVRDEADDRLVTRRAWLLGRTGRPALVLSFAVPGQALPADLVVGTAIDADLCFYPGSLPLRALVAHRYGVAPSLAPAPAVDVRAALAAHADALAADPWLRAWPMLLLGTLVPGRAPGRPWHLVDATGDALGVHGPEPWRLLAATGGHPAVLAGEWGPAGLRPLTAFVDGDVAPA